MNDRLGCKSTVNKTRLVKKAAWVAGVKLAIAMARGTPRLSRSDARAMAVMVNRVMTTPAIVPRGESRIFAAAGSLAALTLGAASAAAAAAARLLPV